MAGFESEDLRAILQEVASDEGGPLDDHLMDVPFCELGYDSLAVIEVLSEIENRQNVAIPDGALEHIRTPRDTVEYVRRLIASDARIR